MKHHKNINKCNNVKNPNWFEEGTREFPGYYSIPLTTSWCCFIMFTNNLLCFFLAKSKLGGENEHIAFLSSKALELQGEVTKAFLHAVIYKSLDPLVFIKNTTFFSLK